jgi:hypothetical protein
VFFVAFSDIVIGVEQNVVLNFLSMVSNGGMEDQMLVGLLWFNICEEALPAFLHVASSTRCTAHSEALRSDGRLIFGSQTEGTDVCPVVMVESSFHR